MSLQELSKYTIVSKYAKYLPNEQRRENWNEIVDRSLNMHLRKFDHLPQTDKQYIINAFQLVKAKKVLPSMRMLQFAGEGVEQKNERGYNCAFLHIHNTRAIEKAFYILLCGAGCGLGLRKKWVDKFPAVVQYKRDVADYVIEDSIEDWATSTKVLINSYLEGNEYTGKRVVFDYTKIRPKGAPISHGGNAPGPDGLKKCHQRIDHLLRTLPFDSLRTIDVYDILMHTADAVLSGGIRRAATIALFDKDDLLMLNAKTGNWFEVNPQRARSNNTVLLKRDEVKQDEFEYIMECTKQWGEPGFAFVDDLDSGLNPCAEVGLNPFWQGTPAVQFCNLSTINGNMISNQGEFYRYAQAATIIGTLQASYTDFKFLDEADRKITEEEALLGVSIMGHMANPKILLNKEILTKCAGLISVVNEAWASKLGINPASRLTCTKPDGNSSCALGSPFSGIHPAHSKKYFRRIQANRIEEPYKYFKQYNPALITTSVQAPDTDDVITFPVEVTSEGAIFKADLTAIQHLDIIKDVNDAWIRPGKKTDAPVSHSISCTVTVGDTEWETVSNYLYENRNNFTTVSLLASTGDSDYAQAPYQAVKTNDDSVMWNLYDKLTVPVDYDQMIETSDHTARNEIIACAGGVCEL